MIIINNLNVVFVSHRRKSPGVHDLFFIHARDLQNVSEDIK